MSDHKVGKDKFRPFLVRLLVFSLGGFKIAHFEGFTHEGFNDGLGSLYKFY